MKIPACLFYEWTRNPRDCLKVITVGGRGGFGTLGCLNPRLMFLPSFVFPILWHGLFWFLSRAGSFLYFWLHCDVGVVFSDFGVDVHIFMASFCIVVYALPALPDWGSDLLIYDV